MQRTLSIVGAGKLGRSLGKLWKDTNVFAINSVCNRTAESTQDALDFIGGGRACASTKELIKSDIILIATPDNEIQKIAELLCHQHSWIGSSVVFHCSGTLGSDIFRALSDAGSATASIHPIKSFANPANAVNTFAGTYCGTEGNLEAIRILNDAFEKIGGICLEISKSHKILYHCAAVVANNYYVSLIEMSQLLYEKAGVTREQSTRLLAPILQETTKNILTLGTSDSLTGPIARGDTQTVSKHLHALNQLDPDLEDIYKSLGKLSLKLARLPEEQRLAFMRILAEVANK